MLAHVGAYSAYATPGRVNQFTCAARQCVALAPRAQSASHAGSENRRGRDLRGRCSTFVFRVTAASRNISLSGGPLRPYLGQTCTEPAHWTSRRGLLDNQIALVVHTQPRLPCLLQHRRVPIDLARIWTADDRHQQCVRCVGEAPEAAIDAN